MEKAVVFWILFVEGNCAFLIYGLNHFLGLGFPASFQVVLFVALGINNDRNALYG